MGIKQPTIHIFLADGLPDGVRVAEITGWTGEAVVCPRSRFPEAKAWDAFARTGVYVLYCQSEWGTLPTVYVGEGDPTRPRLEAHYREKDFWTSLIVFSAKDRSLNKAHVQYLESRLVALARNAKRCVVENGNVPQLPHLGVAERAAMETFLEEMLLIYPLGGLTAFEVPHIGDTKKGPLDSPVDAHPISTGKLTAATPRELSEAIGSCALFASLKPAARNECGRMLGAAADLLWQRTRAGTSAFSPNQPESEFTDFIKRHPRLMECVRHIHLANSEEGRAISVLNLSAGQCSTLLYLMGSCKSDGKAYRAGPPSERSELGLDWSVRHAIGIVEPDTGEEQPGTDPDAGPELSAAERHAVLAKAWGRFLSGQPIGETDIALVYDKELNDDGSLKEQWLDECPVFGGIDLGVPFGRRPAAGGGDDQGT